MPLDIIGAGFGRTGTLSLKLALEELGFGPCYHMKEVMGAPERARAWIEGLDGQPVDWEAVFEGYRATVDWPGAHFWREFVALWPEAKVILSTRDPAAWFKSVHNTIWKTASQVPEAFVKENPYHPGALARRLLREDVFDGKIEDEAHACAVFEAHNAAVQAEVPAERLLVYRPGDGWEPLCRFLDVPVPDSDYPHTNSSEEFASIFGNVTGDA